MLECTRPAHSDSIHCLAASVADSPVVKAAEFRLVGAQVTGTITLQAEGAAPLRLQGVNTDATLPYPGGAVITGFNSAGLETYGSGYSGYLGVPTYLPSNGTWVMQDELTGKPGRGVSLDVQGGKLVMQVFGYQANGQPTFHMGVGNYATESGERGISSARFALQQYAGGRSVGGEPASAHFVQDAGEVVVSVAPSYEATLAQAMVQFPGEAAKPMQRIALESPQSLEDQFFGEWHLPWLQSDDGLVTFTLNRMDGDVATNEDGSVRCQLNAASKHGICRWSGSPGSTYGIDLRNEFVIGYSSLRVRDRHGNLTGLGDVPLD